MFAQKSSGLSSALAKCVIPLVFFFIVSGATAQTITELGRTGGFPFAQCVGEKWSWITFKTSGDFNVGNVFTIELSGNNQGDFTTSYLLYAITARRGSTFGALLPTSITAGGSNYKIRIRSSSPATTGPFINNVVVKPLELVATIPTRVCSGVTTPFSVSNTINSCRFPIENVFTAKFLDSLGNLSNATSTISATGPSSFLAPTVTTSKTFRLVISSSLVAGKSWTSNYFKVEPWGLGLAVKQTSLCAGDSIRASVSASCNMDINSEMRFDIVNSQNQVVGTSFYAPAKLGPAPNYDTLVHQRFAIPASLAQGNYTIRPAGKNRTYTGAASSTFFVKGKPVIGLASSHGQCTGDTLTLAPTADNSLAFLWNTGATTKTIKTSANGNYWLRGISTLGCTTTVATSVQNAAKYAIDSVSVSTYTLNENIFTGINDRLIFNYGYKRDSKQYFCIYEYIQIGIKPFAPWSCTWSGYANGVLIGESQDIGTYGFLFSEDTDSALIKIVARTGIGCLASKEKWIYKLIVPTPALPSIATFCTGSSVTLSATGAEEFPLLWSTGETTSSITVASALDYSVQVNGEIEGCNAVAYVTVTESLPAIIDSVGLATPSGGQIVYKGGQAYSCGATPIDMEVNYHFGVGTSPATTTVQLWQDTTLLSNPFNIVLLKDTTIFRVKTTTSDGCVSEAQRMVIREAPPILDSVLVIKGLQKDYNGYHYCTADTIVLSAEGRGAASSEWALYDDIIGLHTMRQQSMTMALPTNTSSVNQVMLYSANGCESNPKPAIGWSKWAIPTLDTISFPGQTVSNDTIQLSGNATTLKFAANGTETESFDIKTVSPYRDTIVQAYQNESGYNIFSLSATISNPLDFIQIRPVSQHCKGQFSAVYPIERDTIKITEVYPSPAQYDSLSGNYWILDTSNFVLIARVNTNTYDKVVWMFDGEPTGIETNGNVLTDVRRFRSLHTVRVKVVKGAQESALVSLGYKTTPSPIVLDAPINSLQTRRGNCWTYTTLAETPSTPENLESKKKITNDYRLMFFNGFFLMNRPEQPDCNVWQNHLAFWNENYPDVAGPAWQGSTGSDNTVPGGLSGLLVDAPNAGWRAINSSGGGRNYIFGSRQLLELPERALPLLGPTTNFAQVVAGLRNNDPSNGPVITTPQERQAVVVSFNNPDPEDISDANGRPIYSRLPFRLGVETYNSGTAFPVVQKMHMNLFRLNIPRNLPPNFPLSSGLPNANNPTVEAIPGQPFHAVRFLDPSDNGKVITILLQKQNQYDGFFGLQSDARTISEGNSPTFLFYYSWSQKSTGSSKIHNNSEFAPHTITSVGNVESLRELRRNFDFKIFSAPAFDMVEYERLFNQVVNDGDEMTTYVNAVNTSFELDLIARGGTARPLSDCIIQNNAPIGAELFTTLQREGLQPPDPRNPRMWRANLLGSAPLIDDLGNLNSSQTVRNDFFNACSTTVVQSCTRIRNIGGQGLILYDFEGIYSSAFRIADYIGHPSVSVTAALNPEMNIRLNGTGLILVDRLFQIIRDNNLIPGITLRPQNYIPTNVPSLRHDFAEINFSTSDGTVQSNTALVTSLSNKMIHAFRTWGVRIFYIDSPQGSRGMPNAERVPIEASVYRRMLARLVHECRNDRPDVEHNFLIMPEELVPFGIEHYLVSVPFKKFIQNNVVGVDAIVPLEYRIASQVRPDLHVKNFFTSTHPMTIKKPML